MQIFFGGPDDVATEVDELVSLAEKLRPALQAISGSDVRVTNWRRVPPGQGNPQSIIFEDTNFAASSIFVFIFWHRFGSPPGGESDWRKKKKESDPVNFPETKYLSGAEYEFEVALRVARADPTHHRRIMVYRCHRALPQPTLDTEQWRRLNFYFDRRIRNNALFRDFSGVDDLKSRFCTDLVDIVTKMSNGETRAVHALMDLAQKCRRAGPTALVRSYIADECESAATILRSMIGQGGQSCRMRTTDLYDRIVAMMARSKEVRVIDLDIRRWNELMNDQDRLYTMNYSRELLRTTAARASEDASFNLKRIFVIRKTDLDNASIMSRIPSIFKEIVAFLAHEGVRDDAIGNRVFIDDRGLMTRDGVELSEGQFSFLVGRINSTQDFVLCQVADDRVLLKEEIWLDVRKSAFETWGTLSVDAREIDAAERTFWAVWEKSYPIEKAIELLGTNG
jgi:hypothetical protein